MSTTPRERPILFSEWEVLATLAGRKTRLRRVVKPQPPADAEAVGANSYEGPEGPAWFWWKGNKDDLKFWPPTTRGENSIHCPFGQPGDRLWARETWKTCDGIYVPGVEFTDGSRAFPEFDDLHAMPSDHQDYSRKRSPIYMPRWASRITLEITRVRVERVQDITEADAEAEGVAASANYSARDHFGRRWSELNAPRGFGWTVNPWVWVIDFKRIKP